MARMTAIVSLVFLLVGTTWAQQTPSTSLEESPGTGREHIVYLMRALPVSDTAEALNGLLRNEAATATNPPVTIVPVPVNNSLLLGGSSEQLKHVLTLLDQLDRTPASVTLQMLVADMWLSPPTASQERDEPSKKVLAELQQAMKQLESAGLAPDDPEKLESAIRTLEQAGAVCFLARPRILTLDGQQASIQIEQTMPIPAGKSSPEGWSPNVENRKFGLTIKVTPRVLPDGIVALALSLEQSLPIPDRNAWETKSLQNCVKVADGQTVVLADLPWTSAFLAQEGSRRCLLLSVCPQVQAAKEKAR